MAGLQVIFGIIALIFIISALASGAVERSPLSFPMIFLGLGFILGDNGLRIIRVGLDDPTLEIVATLSLSFVLFLDAIHLRLDQHWREWVLPALSLGPGALLTIGLITLAAILILHMAVLNALLLGTVLASVDPVMLSGIVRDQRIPRSIRDSLRTEAGAGDVIVLPILLILIAIVLGQANSVGNWLLLLVQLFLLGPLAGAATGGVLAVLMRWARAHFPISREYRALYGIGGVVASYLIGNAIGGSGFLAVFASGLATALLDYDLCDCFLDYSEITSEMTMLLAFLMFGALLSAIIPNISLFPVVLFAFATLVLARPFAIGLVLQRAVISWRARLFIGWFGPRGLSSLLFALVLVTSGVPGSQQILSVAGVVVILSVILHGISSAPLANRYHRAVMEKTLPEERVGRVEGLFEPNASETARIRPDELAEKMKSANPPIVLDVRSRSSYEHEPDQIPGSIRVLPDYVEDWAADQDRAREVVTYCT